MIQCKLILNTQSIKRCVTGIPGRTVAALVSGFIHNASYGVSCHGIVADHNMLEPLVIILKVDPSTTNLLSFSPGNCCIVAPPVTKYKRVDVRTCKARVGNLIIPCIYCIPNSWIKFIVILAIVSFSLVGILSHKSPVAQISCFVMSKRALTSPSLSNLCELIVPGQFSHITCSRLASLITGCDLLPLFIVCLQELILGSLVQATDSQIISTLSNWSWVFDHCVSLRICAFSSLIFSFRGN